MYISGAPPLPNGNVFICRGNYDAPDMVRKFYDFFRRRLIKSKSSRLFEVNRAGDIVGDLIINVSGENTPGVYQAAQYSEA